MKKGKNGHDIPDRDLWEKVTRSVKPYGRRAAPVAKPAATAGATKPPPAPARPPVAKPAPAKKGKEMDRATATRLSRGQLEIDGRIDLHGKTAEAARRAFLSFLDRAQRSGWRTLLVITGKGRLGDGGGVIRRSLPQWVEDDPRVLRLTPAQPKDGGSGAFYLRLRKPA